MIQTEAVLGQVRHILNEYPAILDEYENETSESLKAFLGAALRMLVNDLNPVYVGSPVVQDAQEKITYKQRPDGLYYGVIAMPEDYLRFVSLKLDPWAMPVVEAHPVGTSLWLSQFSAAAGVGNGEAMPAVFVSLDYQRALEAHAVKASRIVEETIPEEEPLPDEGATDEEAVPAEETDTEGGETPPEEEAPEGGVTVIVAPKYELRYIASPNAEGEGIAVSEKGFDALAYLTAGLYLQSRENGNAADRCIAAAQSYIKAANGLIAVSE